MKELDKIYQAQNVEESLYKRWEASEYFNPNKLPDRFQKGATYTISMPPPNATGILHVGHSLFLTLQDAMIRFERMRGKRALWLPGTDHAGIATQSVVEKKLMQEEGKTKHDLGREVFLEKVKAFAEGSKDTIRSQVRKMGASCDWSREEYTLSENLSRAVQKIFVDMYHAGLIYRGKRIVNWDPKLKTTVADDEIEYEGGKGILYYIQYGPFVVATSRPETKLGDTAVAVNPNDERYQKYIGQVLEIPFVKGHTITVKVIASEEVDKDFGSGALGVTPAHSAIDYEMAQKSGIDAPQVIDLSGKMTEKAGPYAGMDLFACRKLFVEDLRAAGLLVKEEEYEQSIAKNYRGGGIIEPQLLEQWFIDVNKVVVDWKGKKLSFKEILRDVVSSQDITIVPDRFESTYYRWIDNLRDWCISRQIWWGHEIPVWYDSNNTIKVQIENPGEGWVRETDSLDTWFSSGLWPFSTLGWPDTEAKDYKEFFPTPMVETGYDIIFFWVARMILMSTFATHQVPFKTVYLHGLVRDEQGRKMSKSLGNSLNPLDVIEKYGTDALRLGLIIGTTPGNDTRVGEQKIEGYRNFINKIWNIARFVLSQPEVIDAKLDQLEIKTSADAWIFEKLNNLIEEVSQDYEAYRFSAAGEKAYQFIWDDFADWYLEASKIEEYGKNPCMLRYVLETVLKLLHPLIPFVTEEIWSKIYGEAKENMLMIAEWPKPEEKKYTADAKLFEEIKLLISMIRNARTEAKQSPAEFLDASIETEKTFDSEFPVLLRLARIQLSSENISDDAVLLHTSHLHIKINIDQSKLREQKKKEKEELEKYREVLKKKLSHEAYIKNAAADVVENDRKKLEEVEEKIQQLS